MSGVDKSKIKVKRDHDITLPVAHKEERLAIRRFDWNRIKTQIEQIKKSRWKYSEVYCTSFGISVSAFFSAWAFKVTPNCEPWVVPVCVLICIFTLILGIIFVFLQKNDDVEREEKKNALLAEMNEIEALFKPEEEDKKVTVEPTYTDTLPPIPLATQAPVSAASKGDGTK